MPADPLPDEPTDQVHVVNGVVCKEGPAAEKIEIAATPDVMYLFNSNFATGDGPDTLSFTAGIAYALNPDVVAQLLAQNAPMTIV